MGGSRSMVFDYHLEEKVGSAGAGQAIMTGEEDLRFFEAEKTRQKKAISKDIDRLREKNFCV
jgi:hypothetical protein